MSQYLAGAAKHDTIRFLLDTMRSCQRLYTEDTCTTNLDCNWLSEEDAGTVDPFFRGHGRCRGGDVLLLGTLLTFVFGEFLEDFTDNAETCI
jgi:hypothetical protein